MPVENSPSRRAVVRAGTWSVPVIAAAVATPAAASSPTAKYLVIEGFQQVSGAPEFVMTVRNESPTATYTVTKGGMTVSVTLFGAHASYLPTDVNDINGGINSGMGDWFDPTQSQTPSQTTIEFNNGDRATQGFTLGPGAILSPGDTVIDWGWPGNSTVVVDAADGVWGFDIVMTYLIVGDPTVRTDVQRVYGVFPF